MPRWVAIIIVGSLAVCVTCGSLGFVFWRKAQSSVSNEIASVIATQVADNIGARALATGEIVLTEDDLDVNTFITLDGSCGFNVTNGDAEIYGVTTEITPTGIRFGCAGAMYSAVPVILDGRVQLTQFETSNVMMNFVISQDKLKKGVEEGINSALAAKGVTPTGLTLRNGSITILIEGAAL
jgi:hypothetical protein